MEMVHRPGFAPDCPRPWTRFAYLMKVSTPRSAMLLSRVPSAVTVANGSSVKLGRTMALVSCQLFLAPVHCFSGHRISDSFNVPIRRSINKPH